MDVTILGWIEALNKAISQQRSCFAGKLKSHICNILYAHDHGKILPMESSCGKFERRREHRIDWPV